MAGGVGKPDERETGEEERREERDKERQRYPEKDRREDKSEQTFILSINSNTIVCYGGVVYSSRKVSQNVLKEDMIIYLTFFVHPTIQVEDNGRF